MPHTLRTILYRADALMRGRGIIIFWSAVLAAFGAVLGRDLATHMDGGMISIDVLLLLAAGFQIVGRF